MNKNDRISVGVIGGGGYTAGELFRILVNHPRVKIAFVHSESQNGRPVASTHTDLLGDIDLNFTNKLSAVDLVFLCRGHGASRAFLESGALPGNPKVIDLSHDYRLETPGNNFVYGLPEAFREKIKNAGEIANPGCFATCIQLGLIPLAANKLLKETIQVTAITGSTGAGQSLNETSHFSWRNNNLSVYKPFKHQHLGEIKQTLARMQQGPIPEINFLPVRGNFTRGIFASIYMDSGLTIEQAKELFRTFYQDHPFTQVVEENPHLKQVIGTNKAHIYLDKIDDKLLIISIIDNLIKGASGQAVHNMNLAFGLEESDGLKLKSIAF